MATRTFEPPFCVRRSAHPARPAQNTHSPAFTSQACYGPDVTEGQRRESSSEEFIILGRPGQEKNQNEKSSTPLLPTHQRRPNAQQKEKRSRRVGFFPPPRNVLHLSSTRLQRSRFRLWLSLVLTPRCRGSFLVWLFLHNVLPPNNLLHLPVRSPSDISSFSLI